MKSNADDVKRAMGLWFMEHRRRCHVVYEVGLVGGWRWLDGGPDQVVADAAIVGDELEGYEFKSDSDNVSRLSHQLVAYSRVFDRCTLVVGDRLFEQACKLLPTWWGVFSAVGDRGRALRITREREPQPNPVLRPDDLVTLLWRPELLKAMTALGARRGKTTWTVDRLRRELVGMAQLDWIRNYVRRSWREREDWHIRPVARPRFTA